MTTKEIKYYPIVDKNTAYAWRQMIFYLSLMPPEKAQDFIIWADDLLSQQNDIFQKRFSPVLIGLVNALHEDPIGKNGGTRFTGWSQNKHWLLV